MDIKRIINVGKMTQQEREKMHATLKRMAIRKRMETFLKLIDSPDFRVEDAHRSFLKPYKKEFGCLKKANGMVNPQQTNLVTAKATEIYHGN